MSNTYFTYPSGTKITYSFYWMVVGRCGGSHDEAKRVFYRAKEAKDPVKWIVKGFNNIMGGYIRLPCRDEYDNPKAVQSWIDSVINKIALEPKKKVDRKAAPEGLGNILKDVL